MHWFNVIAAADKSEIEGLESLFWDEGAVSVTVEAARDLSFEACLFRFGSQCLARRCVA